MILISANKIQVKCWENFSLWGEGKELPGINSVTRLQSHQLSAKVGVHLGGTGKQQGAWPLFPDLSLPRAWDPCQALPCPPKTAPLTAPTP